CTGPLGPFGGGGGYRARRERTVYVGGAGSGTSFSACSSSELRTTPHREATTTADPTISIGLNDSPKHTQAPMATNGGSPRRSGDDTDVGTYRCAHTISTCAVVPDTIVQAANKIPRPLIERDPCARSVNGVRSSAPHVSVPSMNANGSISKWVRSTRP